MVAKVILLGFAFLVIFMIIGIIVENVQKKKGRRGRG